jgi:chromosome segregation ATPase
MLELLEKTRVFIRGKEEKKIATFAELVKAVADGGKKAPTPAQVDEALEAAGQTLDDLDAAVKYRQDRLELDRQRATSPALQKELDQAGDELNAERARWAKLTKEHQAIEGPLTSKVLRLSQQVALALGCTAKLVDGYRGPLLDELAKIETERPEIHQRMQQIQHTREHHAQWARPASDFQNGRTLHSPTDQERGAHQRIVEDCDQELTELRTRLATLDAREAEIQAEMAKP